MAGIIDNLLGFLPPGAVIFGGAGILVLILAIQYISNLLHQILMLPWMKEKNQQARKQMEQKNNQ